MVETIKVAGYDKLKETLASIDNKRQINVYFTGSKNDDGVSWCPDCTAAEPHVNGAVEKYAGKESVFIIADVGERGFWKDLKNPFRTDKEIFISVIPTIIRWKGPQRLEGSHCEKEDLLKMFFEDS